MKRTPYITMTKSSTFSPTWQRVYEEDGKHYIRKKQGNTWGYKCIDNLPCGSGFTYYNRSLKEAD